MDIAVSLSQLGLQESDIEQVVKIFSENVSLKKGEFFVQNGQTVKGMAFVKAGVFRHFYTNINGKELDHWFTLSGSFLTTFESFITQKPTKNNIQAMREAEILFANKKDWDRLLADNNRVYQAWHRGVENLIIQLEQRIHNFIVLNGEQRYDWLYTTNKRIFDEVPNKYIASMLGITPRHLVRLRARKI